jgi:alpha-tubulin suppressor-like RCC1 family protein
MIQHNYSSPVQIPGTTWSSISTGNDHSLATKTDGTLWSWGPGKMDN